jgi:hypothetical protein
VKTIEHFQKSLARLNEKKFFEISRNLLGDVKTPYNKQDVIERLVSSLTNEELQDVLFSYTTEEEALIINTVDLLDAPSLRDIYGFLTELGYEKCLRLLTLLEERMILYSYAYTSTERYFINPVFEHRLKPILNNKNILFPCVKKSETWISKPPAFTISKRFLFAFFSYIQTGKVRYKANGSLTKKAEDQAKAFFQGGDFFQYYFTEIRSALISLQFLTVSEKTCGVDMPYLEQFFKRPDKECRAYFAAGMCGDKKYAGLVMDFIVSLPPETYYTEATIYRMLDIIFHKTAKHFHLPFDTFVKALKRTGLLIAEEDPDTGEKYYALSPDCAQTSGKTGEPSQGTSPSIVFDSPFSFVVLPNADLTPLVDLLYFSSITDIREYRFTVSKEMVVQCFETTSRKGTSGTVPERNAAWITERLKIFSGDRIDESLIWTIHEWEKRFSEVILHEGLVLYLGKERQYLAESEGLKPYLQKAITENVFIIHPLYRNTVESILTKSGVDIIARAHISPYVGRTMGFPDKESDDFPSITGVPFSPIPLAGKRKPAGNTAAQTVDYRKTFKTLLDSLDVEDNEKQELCVRIDNGLIFSAEQLKKLSIPGTFPHEKTEAHGLDYTGKLLIAKHALSNRSAVEIIWHAKDGEERITGIILGIMKNIKRNPAGDILLVYSNQCEQQIPLGKVSTIRRIKQSIFE